LVDQSDFSYLKEELEQFIKERVSVIVCPKDKELVEPLQDLQEPKKSIVFCTVEEAIEWAVQTKESRGMHMVSTRVIDQVYLYLSYHPKSKVLQSMRTGVILQGRMGIAICLEDLSSTLTNSLAVIRDVVRTSNTGSNHIAQDFVPKESGKCFIL